MHSDAQFAGSSSVPAHVEMMGFLGIGNNPMVGCSVACAVDVGKRLQDTVQHKKSRVIGPARSFSSDLEVCLCMLPMLRVAAEHLTC